MENYKILVSAAHEKKNGTAEHAETAESHFSKDENQE
jgi:hypothetical protein